MRTDRLSYLQSLPGGENGAAVYKQKGDPTPWSFGGFDVVLFFGSLIPGLPHWPPLLFSSPHSAAKCSQLHLSWSSRTLILLRSKEH